MKLPGKLLYTRTSLRKEDVLRSMSQGERVCKAETADLMPVFSLLSWATQTDCAFSTHPAPPLCSPLVPTVPPGNVHAEATNSTTIRFTWNAPSPQFINGINQGYKVREASPRPRRSLESL